MLENISQEILTHLLTESTSPFCACLATQKTGTVLALNGNAVNFFNTAEKKIIGKELPFLFKKFGVTEFDFLEPTAPENSIKTFSNGHKSFLHFIKKVHQDAARIPLTTPLLVLFWTEIPSPKSERSEPLIHDFDVLLDSIHDGIWIINGNGITLYANKAMKRIAGISPKDVIGKHVTIPMIQGKFTNCVTLIALAQKKTVTQFDDYSNGKHCLNTSTPILDENGNVERVVAIIRDMCEYDDLHKKVLDAEQTVKQYKGELKKFENGSKLLAPAKHFKTVWNSSKKLQNPTLLFCFWEKQEQEKALLHLLSMKTAAGKTSLLLP